MVINKLANIEEVEVLQERVPKRRKENKCQRRRGRGRRRRRGKEESKGYA
jgi:hypothetical protein